MMTMTPDPITQEAFYASVPLKRFVAWVIDTILIAVLSLIAIPFTAFSGLFFLPILMLVIGFFYRWLTLASGSATWGMRLVAVELREADDLQLARSTALLHTLGYTVSFAMPVLQVISVVLMLTTARKQGLTDLILGTVALNTRR